MKDSFGMEVPLIKEGVDIPVIVREYWFDGFYADSNDIERRKIIAFCKKLNDEKCRRAEEKQNELNPKIDLNSHYDADGSLRDHQREMLEKKYSELLNEQE